MWILSGLFLCAAVGLLYSLAGPRSLWRPGSEFALFSGFLFTAIFVLALLAVPCQRYAVHVFEARVEAIRATKAANDWQDAAWRSKAADVNADLAEYQYDNAHWFGPWIPDSIDRVKPL